MITTDKVLLNDWHPVAKLEDCQPGKILTVRLLEEDLVLWRPLDPQAPLLVWQDYCPHRGARMSLGEVGNNTLVCAYHGWEYDTAGKCAYIPAHPTLQPPAAARIKTYQCRERYGLVWVCLGNPSVDVPLFPEWDAPDYMNSLSGPHPVNTSAFRMMENAMDIAHFPFIHKGILGDRNCAQVEDYEVEVDADGMTISNMRISLSTQDGTNNGTQFMLQKKLRHPLVEYTITHTVGDSPHVLITDMVAITPIEEEKCMVWLLHTLNRAYEMLESQTDILDKLAHQDSPIAESQRPARLPLLPRRDTDTKWPEELHVPSDRASVAYRRWLKQLGITFGVC